MGGRLTKIVKSVAKVAASPLTIPAKYVAGKVAPNGYFNERLGNVQPNRTDFETAAAVAAAAAGGAYLAGGTAGAAGAGAGAGSGAGAGLAGAGATAGGSSMVPWALGGLGALGGIYSGNQAAQAARDAAAMQQDATNRATAENARQFDIGQQNLAPWLQAGTNALASQQSLMGLTGHSTPADTLAQLQMDPGYQFRMEQGQKAFDSSALARRGGFGSGSALTSAINYNQGAASQEYGNRLNQLAGISNTGQTTGNQLGAMGANYANNQGNLWTGNANAQGAAGIAGANARQSGLMGGLGLGLAGANLYNNWGK